MSSSFDFKLAGRIHLGLSIAFVALYLPLMTYYGYRYYRTRQHVALKQRYASINIIEIILSCLFTGCSLWILSPVSLEIFYTGFNNLDLIQGATLWVLDITFLLLHGCWFLRFWMIRYDMKFVNATYNKQWMYIINPYAIQLIHYEWYYQHKNTFGNFKWMIHRFIVPWILFSIAWSVTAFFMWQCDKDICGTIGSILIIIWIAVLWLSWVALLIIYCTMPKLQDTFYVCDELKRLIVVHVFQGIICTVAMIFQVVANPNHVIGFGYFIQTHFAIDVTFLMIGVLISTWWVLRMLGPSIIISPTLSETNKLQNREEKSALLSISNRLSTIFNSIQSTQLRQILKNNKAFEVYMMHLCKELSLEFLLAFIEIIQMQKFIATQIEMDDRFNNLLFLTVEFCDDVVKSNIVYDDNNANDEEKRDQEDNIKFKSNKLYVKYIEYGAEYEIVLNADTHDRIADVMSHLDWIEDDTIDVNIVLELWDSVSKELFILLLDAFGRFQATIQYRNLELIRLH